MKPGERDVLLIVDVQNDFCPGGALAVPQGDEIVPAVNRLAADEAYADLVPAVHELRATYTTRQRDMDPALIRRLGLFDYLRARLAIAGTPDDCVAQVRAAEAAGVTQLMFTVSLAADPQRAVELFGTAVLPRLARA